MHFLQMSPDDRQVLPLARYSLVQPRVNGTILRAVVSGEPFQWVRCHALSDRVVACVCQRFVGDDPIRVVTMDVITKSYRILLLERPVRDCWVGVIWHGDMGKRQLLVVYFQPPSVFELELEDRWRVALHNVVYDIPSDPANYGLVIKPRSSESISCRIDPVTVICCVHIHYAPPILVFRRSAHVGDPSMLIFDRSLGTWRFKDIDRWRVQFGETKEGMEMTQSVRAFESLFPPTDWRVCQLPGALKYLYRIRGVEEDGSVYCFTSGDGIAQFCIRPPPLKRLAAEAFCAANPKFNLARLKCIIGFDVFDGLADPNYENNSPIIYL